MFVLLRAVYCEQKKGIREHWRGILYILILQKNLNSLGVQAGITYYFTKIKYNTKITAIAYMIG